MVNDFRLERAEAVAAEVEKLGCKALAAQCDVTDFAGVARMFEQARQKFGSVDILVNNAGNAGPDSECGLAQALLGAGTQRLAAAKSAPISTGYSIAFALLVPK